MKPHAKIVGYTGRNIGDEAYRKVFPLLLPQYDLTYGSRCLPTDNPDLLILGGGDVVLPSYTDTFDESQRAKTVVVSVSINEGSDFDFIRQCRRVIVRDQTSLALCLEQGVRGAEILPDYAFVLTGDAERGRAWIERAFRDERKDLYENVVVMVPNGYTIFGSHDIKTKDFNKALSVADDLAYICDHTNASFVFLPFSTQHPDDRLPGVYINSRCKFHQKNLVVFDRLDIQTTLDVMSASNAVIGSRLHSVIFSSIAAKPFIALSHHSKIDGFVSEVGRSSWLVDFYSFDRSFVLRLLMDHLGGHSKTSDLVFHAARSRSQILSSSL